MGFISNECGYCRRHALNGIFHHPLRAVFLCTKKAQGKDRKNRNLGYFILPCQKWYNGYNVGQVGVLALGNISVSLPSDGSVATVSQYNTPINTIVNEINGNLDNSNIAANAAIDGSKLADGSVTSSKLADGSVTSSKIDFGGAGAGVWWEEIGRTTLSSAGNTISVTDLPKRRYLKIIFSAVNTGGTINASMTFNGDTGNNYARRYSSNGGTETTGASESSIGIGTTTGAYPVFIELEVFNLPNQEKLVNWFTVDQNTAGAANLPNRRQGVAKWANTTDQVDRIDITNAGTGLYAIGSEAIVLGHD